MLKSPVLFVIFNRPDTTAKVFEAIRSVKPAQLFIAADGPRNEVDGEKEKCLQAREIVLQVDWECEVKILFREENLGCSLGPRGAFDWFFSNVEEGIILEDDCVPDSSFFFFCEAMLEKYRNNDRIISINGSNLGYESTDGNSYFFSRWMNMWGWATWKRSAREIDYSLNEWRSQKKPLWTLYKRMRQNIFDLDINWYKYWQHKFDLTVTREKVSWWDWQWIYHQVKYHRFSIVPALNLVSNIGFSSDATHTREMENPAAKIKAHGMMFPLKHPQKIKNNIVYEELFVKQVWCYHKRMPAFLQLKIFIRSVLGLLPKEKEIKLRA